ncbi:MAG: phosphoribosyltransferase [Gammaproteobacteria bacterium]
MTSAFTFENRAAAGRLLSKRIQDYTGRPYVVVLGLAPGGVPVACEVAQNLKLPLDVLVARKLGVPEHPELVMGVIVSGGARYLNKDVIRRTNVSRKQFDTVFNSEIVELQRRERLYREHREPADITNHTVILVDDGTTSCEMLRAVAMALRARHPKQIVLALPVAAVGTAEHLGAAIDDFECVYSPQDFQSARQYYANFSELNDDSAHELFVQILSHSDKPAPVH